MNIGFELKNVYNLLLCLINFFISLLIENKIKLLLPDLLETKVSVYPQDEKMLSKLYSTEGSTSDLVIMPKTFFKGFTRFPYLDLKNEYHEEYFSTIEKILPGMKKCIRKSFISEHMIFNVNYELSFIIIPN